MNSKLDLFKKTLEIAIHDLRSCYEGRGIIAGRHHFTDYWGRDAFFAAFGSYSIGDLEKINELVELFFHYQRKDGLIPYRIMRSPLSFSRYWGKEAKLYTIPHANYRLRWIGPIVLDSTVLSIILWAMLVKNEFKANISKENIILSLGLLKSQEKFGLLWEGVMTEWNDTAWKHGNLLYTNILYWKMYDELNNCKGYFNESEKKDIENKRLLIAKDLRKRLWNGECFADWNGYKRHDYFYSYGNLLAIAWGFTTPEETELILGKAKKAHIQFTLESNYPKYPWWRIDLFNHLTGTADYQNMGLLWLAPAASYVLALLKAKRKKEAEKFLSKVCKRVLKDGTVYEVYDRNGNFMKRRFYQSEHPFAWASGLLTASLMEFLKKS